ncbi:beta-lactamase-like protein [Mycena floridula]|nr:beta-lactamase-like protein [Mycena floridula]
MSITFLGTSSGGGPTATRNCSSLVADVLGTGSLWMVDCAEGTARQFLFQPWGIDNPRVSKIAKIFITHMHADHVMGLVPLLRNLLFVPNAPNAMPGDDSKPPRVEVYGPAGIRQFVRSILKMTLTRTTDLYVCHELLRTEDTITACDSDPNSPAASALHSSELPGRDIRCSADGFWREFTSEEGAFGQVYMDADPCLGFIVRESVSPFRKIVILGDTCDPTSITPLCIDPSPSLLIHEATDAHIPPSVDPKSRRPLELVLEKTAERGHSIPKSAGEFAKKIGAQKLVLNHLGGRFPAPGPRDRDPIRANVIREIERQASEAWGMGQAKAAWDHFCVAIPAPGASIQYEEQQEEGPTARNTWNSDKSGQRTYGNGHRPQHNGYGGRRRQDEEDRGDGWKRQRNI